MPRNPAGRPPLPPAKGGGRGAEATAEEPAHVAGVAEAARVGDRLLREVGRPQESARAVQPDAEHRVAGRRPRPGPEARFERPARNAELAREIGGGGAGGYSSGGGGGAGGLVHVEDVRLPRGEYEVVVGAGGSGVVIVRYRSRPSGTVILVR